MKASKKIFSLLLGTSMFFTGMPECFAMMESAGQDPTLPLPTGVPSEEAAGDSSGPASPAPESPDSTDITAEDLSRLFDAVPTRSETSSTFGTAVLLPSEGEGEGVVRPQAVEDVAAADSAAHDAEPEVRDDVSVSDETLSRFESPIFLSDCGETFDDEPESERSSTPLSRSPSPSSDEGETSGEVVAPQPQVIREGEPLDGSLDVGPAAGAGTALSRSSSRSSDGGETSDDESESEREEEDVAPPAPLLPSVTPGIIAEAVHISAPGTGKSSFFAKTVDVAVVAHPSLSGDVVTNFVSRVWNPTAGKCTVNGTKRKVKFDLIDPYNLNSLKNHRVIISLLNPGFEYWRLAEDSFLRVIQPINSRASVIFVSVNSDTLASDVVRDMSDRAVELTTADRKVAYATDADTNMNPTSGFLPFIVRLFDEADSNFSSWTPSQITGAKRGGIAAACVGGAWIAMNKIFKKPNPKKLKKQHKEDKKSEQNQIANV